MAQPANTDGNVMLRVARGMSVAGIASDLDLSVGSILDVLWRHGDDGAEACRNDPTPSQIRLRALAIRAGWTPEESLARRVPVMADKPCGGSLFE